MDLKPGDSVIRTVEYNHMRTHGTPFKATVLNVEKITPAGFIYAGTDKYRGHNEPLLAWRPRNRGMRQYRVYLWADTPDNRKRFAKLLAKTE